MTDGIRIHITNDPMFAENGYTVFLREGGPCWIIDPGLPPQAKKIAEFIRNHDLQPAAIVLTHAHADHIAGIDAVLDATGQLPVHLARGESPMLTSARENLSAGMGMPITVKNAHTVLDLPVGGHLNLEDTKWTIGDVAGHSPAGRSFHCPEHKIVFVGDALFAGSVGRVDFPHSDGETLIANIRGTLMTLPDDTRVLSGHGPETTIGRERRTNPYLLHGI